MQECNLGPHPHKPFFPVRGEAPPANGPVVVPAAVGDLGVSLGARDRMGMVVSGPTGCLFDRSAWGASDELHLGFPVNLVDFAFLSGRQQTQAGRWRLEFGDRLAAPYPKRRAKLHSHPSSTCRQGCLCRYPSFPFPSCRTPVSLPFARGEAATDCSSADETVRRAHIPDSPQPKFTVAISGKKKFAVEKGEHHCLLWAPRRKTSPPRQRWSR